MNPLLNIWDTAGSTPVLGRGVDVDVTLQPFRFLALRQVLNFSDASRIANKLKSTYEWNNPWTLRTGVHFTLCNQQVHLYFDYLKSKGLPYFDFNEKQFLQTRNYSRLDCNFQYRSKMLRHRYFTRYDAYFNITNLFSVDNIREYYWNQGMVRQPVYLGPILMDIGFRVGFRL
jgi:hypothetical protein